MKNTPLLSCPGLAGILLGGLVLLIALPVFASDRRQDDGGNDGNAETKERGGDRSTSGQREVRAADEVPAGQRGSFAKDAVEELGESTRKLLRLISDAQESKDVVLLNCLNEKLGSLRALEKVTSDSRFNFQENVARENIDLQEHNFRKVQIARSQGATVAAEADACVGQVGMVSAGQTRVVVNIDGDGNVEVIVGPSVPGGSTRPPDSSPFRE